MNQNESSFALLKWNEILLDETNFQKFLNFKTQNEFHFRFKKVIRSKAKWTNILFFSLIEFWFWLPSIGQQNEDNFSFTSIPYGIIPADVI